MNLVEQEKLLEKNSVSLHTNYVENKENLIEDIILKKISNLEKEKYHIILTKI